MQLREKAHRGRWGPMRILERTGGAEGGVRRVGRDWWAIYREGERGVVELSSEVGVFVFSGTFACCLLSPSMSMLAVVWFVVRFGGCTPGLRSGIDS